MTPAEENYLAAIFKISQHHGTPVGTTTLSEQLGTTPASVSDMLKKLSDKSLIHYEKYYGARLTDSGNTAATKLVRKHRLWETFLVKKLNFSWAEVHEIADQLEHIKSDLLVERLDTYLDFPRFDPHGDPIPDAAGKFTLRKQERLRDLNIGEGGVVVGVQDHGEDFLTRLDRVSIQMGTIIHVLDQYAYDKSVKVSTNDSAYATLSDEITRKIYVRKI
ncbi:MAG: metal-dependent transcriptional regulator [Saprospiraceae bacterium]|nr:metal-dependent transcriptional regulator [Saprospiraceae bacterium]